MGSDQVTIELPPNWYEDKDLLGFALCGVYTDEVKLGFFCITTRNMVISNVIIL